MIDVVELTCAGCACSFARSRSEVTRQERHARSRFYCSRSCYARTVGKYNLGADLGQGHVDVLNAGNRRDRWSPYRYFLRKARNRDPYTDLDLPYLADLWEQQVGRCAISGILMALPPDGLAWERLTRDPWKPSLDRMDSSHGYVRGNVRFVTVIANLAKGTFTDEELGAFCRAVVEASSGGALTAARHT